MARAEGTKKGTPQERSAQLNMNEVRNLDGKLVCSIRSDVGIVEIVKKDCVTLIQLGSDGTMKVTHTRKTGAV